MRDGCSDRCNGSLRIRRSYWRGIQLSNLVIMILEWSTLYILVLETRLICIVRMDPIQEYNSVLYYTQVVAGGRWDVIEGRCQIRKARQQPLSSDFQAW